MGGRGGGSGRVSAAVRLQSSGLRDADLGYLRTGMRPMTPFRDAYASAKNAGIGPTRVAATGVYPGGKFPPIRVNVDSNGNQELADGRHRYLAAREAGAKAIRARVVEYGPRGSVRSDRVVVLPLR